MFFRTLRGAATQQKPKARLIEVVSITPGRQHAWCASDMGLIRKPLAAIPKSLMNDYANRMVRA